MLQTIVEWLTELIATPGWGHAAALAAGLLASLSPCCLATIPLAVGYVGGYAGGERRKVLSSALALVSGLTVSFTVLGALAGQLGVIWLNGPFGRLVLGGLIVILGLHIATVITIRWPVMSPRVAQNSGLIGGFLLGAAFGTIASPCATPAFVAILALSATTASPWYAASLMAAYAIGHWATILIAALAAGYFPAAMANSGLTKLAGNLVRGMGILLVVVGVWMLSDALLLLR